MSLCAFCNKPGSSEEDVFAKWMADVIGGKGMFNLRRAHGRNKTNLRYFGVTTRAACRRCNNGWMSRFEEAAKPLITPVIQSKPATWASVSDRTTVARWALKTALMLDRQGRPETWVAPAKDFRYLFTRQAPPPSVTILLGHYVPIRGEEFFAFWGGTVKNNRVKFSDGREIDSYGIAFSVGHAMFQTYGQIGTDFREFVWEGPALRGGPPFKDAWRRLWPLDSKPHEWPPRGTRFSSAGLQLLIPDREVQPRRTDT